MAPMITMQSSDSTALEGTTLDFVVGASGDAPLSFQWYKNGAPIAGATASTYTTQLLTMADSGAKFHAVVSNAGGQAATTTATVTVLPKPDPPVVTSQPTNQRAQAGTTATFSVSAMGSAPLTYQWRRNGMDIPGANSATYTTPPLQVSGSGSAYSVLVSNAVGWQLTSPAILTVDPPPPQSVNLVVDPAVQSYLVALGSMSGQAGEQDLPASGSAEMTVSSYGVVGSLPIRYDVNWALDQLAYYKFLGDLSVQRSLALTRHVAGTVAGVELDRYDGAMRTDSAAELSRFGMDLVTAPRSGFDVAIGNWKFIGFYQQAYYIGYPTRRGSFIVGEPTPSAAVAGISSGTYQGFSHGGLEYELLNLDRFEEFSSEAQASYDATMQQLTLTVSNFAIYNGLLNDTNMISRWPQAQAGPVTILDAGTTLSCVVTINPSTNEMTCPLSDGAGLTGTFTGKFYGAQGNEIAGTFSFTGLIRFSFEDGVVGAVALKRQ